MFNKPIKTLLMMVVWLLGVVAAAMHAIGDTTYESAGEAVNVTVDADVSAGQVAYAEGWLGIAGSDAESGDSVALDISHREFQLQIPTSLDVSKGDTIYIDVADLTGNTPDSTAYATTSGGTKVAAFKATSDHWTYDSLRYVSAIQITY